MAGSWPNSILLLATLPQPASTERQRICARYWDKPDGSKFRTSVFELELRRTQKNPGRWWREFSLGVDLQPRASQLTFPIEESVNNVMPVAPANGNSTHSSISGGAEKDPMVVVEAANALAKFLSRPKQHKRRQGTPVGSIKAKEPSIDELVAAMEKKRKGKELTAKERAALNGGSAEVG